jgi:hypothetical protein
LGIVQRPDRRPVTSSTSAFFFLLRLSRQGSAPDCTGTATSPPRLIGFL